MKKRLLFLLTGGTICSFGNAAGVRDVNLDAAEPLLLQMAGKEAENFIFDVRRPLDTLSENMTVEKWNILLHFLQNTDLSPYAGILIAHGTDTLHLTAPLFSALLQGTGKPVCFVSADRPPDDPLSNAPANMQGAVALLSKLSSAGRSCDGGYAVYRNSDGILYVHRASEIRQIENGSSDLFSRHMTPLSDVPEEREKQAENGIPALFRIRELRDNVLVIHPYTGLRYSRILLDGVSGVLHLTYHSGTCCTENVLPFLERCRKTGTDFYLWPCDSRHYDYASVTPLLENGAIPLAEETWEHWYTSLLIRYAVPAESCERRRKIWM